jgi:hypothetical protein
MGFCDSERLENPGVGLLQESEGLCCEGLGYNRVVGSVFVAMEVEDAMADVGVSVLEGSRVGRRILYRCRETEACGFRVASR